MGTDIGYFCQRSRRGDSQSPTMITQNPIQEMGCDQNLEAAFARLGISPYGHRTHQSGAGCDITCGSGVENSINNFTVNQQRLLPYLMQTTEARNVELPRLMSQNGGIGNGEYVGTRKYWTGTNTGEWDGQAYQVADVIEQYPTHNSLVCTRRRLGREELSGQLLRSMPFVNLKGSSFDVFSNSCPSMNDSGHTKLNTTRSSMNDRRVHWPQKPMNHLCLENFRGDLVALAKDQYGCRLLQKTMEDITDKKVHVLFMELIEHVAELMIDPFGNYVVQKLIEVCSEEQRTQILLMVTMTDFQLVSICLNMHGTRAVQKLLDHLTTKEQISLVMSAVSPCVVALTEDTNGHHVIQHCLKHFSIEDNRYLLNEVADNCVKIATDKSGCCVLQQCVDYSHGDLKKRLIAGIISNSFLLATDQYGNYVVQHLLGLKMPSVTASLLRQLQGSNMSLSCNKYGSNVVEKCLAESGREQSAQIIMELLRNQNVSMLLLDPYGNYVIQTALSVSKVESSGHIYGALLNLVRMNCPKMRNNPYGKKILAWFQKRKTQHC